LASPSSPSARLRIWDYGFYVKFALGNPKSKIRIPK